MEVLPGPDARCRREKLDFAGFLLRVIGVVGGVLVQKGSKLEVDSETTLALLVLTAAASSEEAVLHHTGEAPAYGII